MGKHKRNPTAVRLNESEMARLDNYVALSGIARNRIIKNAIAQYLDDRNAA